MEDHVDRGGLNRGQTETGGKKIGIMEDHVERWG